MERYQRRTARLTAQVRVVVRELERVFMLERAAHAREVAAVRGVRAGRPRKLTADQLAVARAAIAAEQKPDAAAAAFGVSRSTLYRYLAETELENRS